MSEASMQSRLLAPPDTVFERTRAGQREALDDRLGLGAADRRILLMVNGFTPFSELAARMPEVPNAGSRARELLEGGLIAEVEATGRTFSERAARA
jgi:hypothetical protein